MLFATTLLFAADSEPRQIKEISLTDAKGIVSRIEGVHAEFKRNATCTLTAEASAGSGCKFYLILASCTPARDDAGLLKRFGVNKFNGDVQSFDAPNGTVLSEPALAEQQRAVAKKYRIDSKDLAQARPATLEGCVSY